MKTGKAIEETIKLAGRLSSSSSQSGSSDESASKEHKTTGTTYLNTTDSTPSKVDMDKALSEGETKKESEAEKAEKKRAKEAKEEAKQEGKRVEEGGGEGGEGEGVDGWILRLDGGGEGGEEGEGGGGEEGEGGGEPHSWRRGRRRRGGEEGGAEEGGGGEVDIEGGEGGKGASSTRHVKDQGGYMPKTSAWQYLVGLISFGMSALQIAAHHLATTRKRPSFGSVPIA
jgi:hypothetical protein